jgi:protein TonB
MKNIALLISFLLFSEYCLAQSKQTANIQLQVPVNDIEEVHDPQLTSSPVASKADSIYRYAHEMPSPDFDLVKYLNTNMSYPVDALESHIQGRVNVEFVVNEDGSISNLKVVSEILGGGLEEEAIRLISGMPKWKPAQLNGKPVKAYFTFPITFRIG